MSSNRIFMLLLGAAVSTCVHAAPVKPVSGSDLVTGQPVDVQPGAKGLVVAFLSARCPCSNSHVGALTELATEFKDFRFVGVHSNRDESEADARSYFARLKLPFPVIQDGDLGLADRFRALKTPHIFVVNADGEIAFQGGVSDSADFSRAEKHYLREALANLRAGRSAPQASVRTLGCTISRRSNHDVR